MTEWSQSLFSKQKSGKTENMIMIQIRSTKLKSKLMYFCFCFVIFLKLHISSKYTIGNYNSNYYPMLK